MFREHPQFSPPQETDIRIWRYLDFTKFVSLLDRQALFFARSHKLNDPFEGSYARANRRQRSVPNDELPDRVYKQGQSGKDIRKNTLINSWHMNEQESAAMWQLYLKSDEGVAIQSTYRRLTESFHATKEDVFVGIVKYIDYNRDMMPAGDSFYPFLYKRKHFQHESELRAVVQLPNVDETVMAGKGGIYVPVDMDRLIETIYISPTAERWVKALVESVLEKYAIEKRVVDSTLCEEPSFQRE